MTPDEWERLSYAEQQQMIAYYKTGNALRWLFSWPAFLTIFVLLCLLVWWGGAY